VAPRITIRPLAIVFFVKKGGVMEKIFIFDVYGIIFRRTNYEKLYRAIHAKIPLKDFRNVYLYTDYAVLYEKGLISTYEFLDKFLKDTHSNATHDEYIEAYINFEQSVYEDTIKLIKQLKEKGFKVGICSNLKKLNLIHLSNVIDLNDLDYEFYSCYVHDLKPSIDLFNHIAKITDAKNNDVYFFDDTKENCDAASRCGIKTIHTTGDNIIEDLKRNVDVDLLQ